MSLPEESTAPEGALTAYFWSGERIRSRRVSGLLLHDTLDIPLPPERLRADWEREVARLDLGIGDIEALPLARTIMRWPDYPGCAQAVATWLQGLALPALLEESNDLALMACRGTPYHHDGEQYGNAVFCNFFLSEDRGMDLHFAALNQRIPLTRGTVVIFDTAQPHAVIPRGCSGFNSGDFPADQDCTQLFLTWELPVENVPLNRAMQIDFDIDPAGSALKDAQKVCANGTELAVCPASGNWYPVRLDEREG